MSVFDLGSQRTTFSPDLLSVMPPGNILTLADLE